MAASDQTNKTLTKESRNLKLKQYIPFSVKLNASITEHCLKSVQIRSYFWSVFSCICIEYGDLLRKSPYSIQIQENTDQK